MNPARQLMPGNRPRAQRPEAGMPAIAGPRVFHRPDLRPPRFHRGAGRPDQEKLDGLAAQLTQDGIDPVGFPADVMDRPTPSCCELVSPQPVHDLGDRVVQEFRLVRVVVVGSFDEQVVLHRGGGRVEHAGHVRRRDGVVGGVLNREQGRVHAGDVLVGPGVRVVGRPLRQPGAQGGVAGRRPLGSGSLLVVCP